MRDYLQLCVDCAAYGTGHTAFVEEAVVTQKFLLCRYFYLVIFDLYFTGEAPIEQTAEKIFAVVARLTDLFPKHVP